jgi:hypothetical protein
MNILEESENKKQRYQGRPCVAGKASGKMAHYLSRNIIAQA